MIRSIARILRLPFYLWLLAIYPIVYLYSENLGLVFDYEVPRVAGLMLVATSIGFLVANRVLKNIYQSALLLSFCVLVFSLSGHIYILASAPVQLLDWTIFAVFALWISLVLLHRSVSANFYQKITSTFNLLSLALLILPAITIASDLLTRSDIALGLRSNGASFATGQPSPKIKDSPTHPDIYYIIPDGYPSDGWLREAMNYDNSDFTRALESRGFAVVDHAQSNYGATLLSMASVLNMQFYDSNESPAEDLDYLRLSIADNAIARQLQLWGYTIVQFLSGYLLPSPIADINRDFSATGPINIEFDRDNVSAAINEGIQFMDRQTIELGRFYKQSFISSYLDTTLLRVFASDIMAIIEQDESRPYGLFAPERFLDTIAEIESIVAMPEASFTFVHLLKPHRPTVFDALGNKLNAIIDPSHEQFFAEFGFTNSKFLQMIDAILEGSQNQPVIVFQADHATTYGGVWTRDDNRLTHFGVYAAYLLPDSYSISVPKPFTLINTFPLIFNEVFETDYPMQGNQLFDVPSGYEAPFEQVDVTDAFIQQ